MISINRGVGQGVSVAGPFRGSKPLPGLLIPAIIKPAFDEPSPRPFL